jgi:serine/threonine protein kinase
MSDNPEHDSADSSLLDDPRLRAAVQDYLAELEAGRRPDRRAWLARHADLADALAVFLDGLDLVHAAHPAPPPAADPVEPLGDFRIVREIGRGGMGVVYEAVQLSLGRRVALKVLPFAAALDTRHLQRFKNEAQAAAGLHHSNIVPVHAVGCDRGTHFYAMQLIQGRSLAAVIRELRREAGLEADASPPEGSTTPAAALTTQRSGKDRERFRTAARLIKQAAEALEYAHRQGIVHRDVKPANLLLDDQGHLWVTDFGLAQCHADAGLTQTGDLLGTLRYMSPEQASGRPGLLDHRADVYALGATLYELLTLRPIFSGRSRQELLHAILNDEPPRPRSLDRAIPAELETIVLKATAKAAADRYATAQDFADDLQRFLDEKPILARRPSLLDHGRKWLRRHPSFVAAGVFVLAGCVVALLVSNRLIDRERARADAAYRRELLRAEEAERRYHQARRVADLLTQLAEQELADNPALIGVRKKMLQVAAEEYREFLEQRRNDPEAQAALAAETERLQKMLDELATLRAVGDALLLGDGAVQDDLKLTAEQREKLRGLWPKQPQPPPWSGSPAGRSARMLETARACDRAIQEVLTGRQRRRLRQIALQVQGLLAFRDPEVADALGLTTAQRQKVREAEAEAFAGLLAGPGFGPPPPPPGGPPPGPPPKEPPERPVGAGVEPVLAVLSEGQKRKWRELTGEPFAGLRRPFPGGPPRRTP